MRNKYIEERFSRWMIFGESHTEDKCDVVDSDGDIICGITHDQANILIYERDKILNAFIDVINSIPDEDAAYDLLIRVSM